MTGPAIGRRRLLAATAALLSLSGCQTGRDEPSEPTATSTPQPTTTARTERTTHSPTRTRASETATETYRPTTTTESDLPTPEPTPEQNPDIEEIRLEEEGLSDGDSLDPYFDEYLDSGNQIIVPEGEYTHSESRDVIDVVDVGIIGDGRVVIDQGDGYTNRWTHQGISGRYEMRNITWRGAGAAGRSKGPWGSFSADEDGEIRILNCAWPDGTQERSDGHCMYVYPEHEGDLLVRGSHIEGFADNGIYGSQPGRWGGTVRVENCFFKDNNVANVRLGSDDSYVKDSVLVQTGNAPLTASGDRYQPNVKHRSSSDIRVENCDLVQTGESPTLSIHPSLGAGSLEMVGNRLRHTSPTEICNQNPDVDVVGEDNQFTGEWDDSLTADLFACINDDCAEPDTDWTLRTAPSNGD